MSTTQEKIAVMQAHAEGKSIELRAPGVKHWTPAPSPAWNWASWEYRVAEDPLDKAVKIYIDAGWPGQWTIRDYAPEDLKKLKAALEAVISAVKSGEL